MKISVTIQGSKEQTKVDFEVAWYEVGTAGELYIYGPPGKVQNYPEDFSPANLIATFAARRWLEVIPLEEKKM
jgi:hypothetical protein